MFILYSSFPFYYSFISFVEVWISKTITRFDMFKGASFEKLIENLNDHCYSINHYIKWCFVFLNRTNIPQWATPGSIQEHIWLYGHLKAICRILTYIIKAGQTFMELVHLVHTHISSYFWRCGCGKAHKERNMEKLTFLTPWNSFSYIVRTGKKTYSSKNIYQSTYIRQNTY